jgi:hypothetical protein
MEYYRYYEVSTTSGVEVYFCTFIVLKKTTKGVWIDNYGNKKFVLNDARKKFACPTKGLAKESFIARKKRQIQILNKQLQKAKAALFRIELMSSSIVSSDGEALINQKT